MRMLALLLLLAVPAQAVEILPFYQLEFMGGLYYFSGTQAPLSGNAAGLAAPAIVVNEQWTVLPTISARYQGTKSIVDLIGPGTLFQERMEHRLGLKGVWTPEKSKWRFKPSIDYRMELLNETRDESWGNGLFDYRMIDLGFEAEYVYLEPYSVRAAFDIVLTDFPNYTSLESQIALDFQGQPISRELIGDQVLNSRTEMLTLAASRGFLEQGTLSGTLVLQRQTYGKQMVVDNSGQLGGDPRRDIVAQLSGVVRWPFELTPRTRLTAAWTLGLENRVSNQNSFDAQRIVYQSGFYNSTRIFFGPDANLSFGDDRAPILWQNSIRFSARRYPHRRVQDASGAYENDTLRQHEWTLATTLIYPMAPRFKLLMSLQAGRASANQGFEQFYKYSYSVTSALVGLRFEY
jgi:hypothetical protein